MPASSRPNGGPAVLPEPRAAPDPGLIRPEDEVGRFDARYVGSLALLRWSILLAYVAIFFLGLITVHPLAMLGSAGWIGFTNVLATCYWWYWRQGRNIPWYDLSYSYLDLISVISGVLATANLNYPIWLAFFMIIVQPSAEQTTRNAILYDLICLAAYLGCVGVLYAAGWFTPIAGTVVVVALLLLFVGLDLTVTFDGSRRLRAYIRRLAVTDPLTGLANRRRLFDILARGLPRGGDPAAVIVLDVDNFKPYNDGYGHLAGDQLLVRLARTLESEFPDAAVVSRYGGDEFVVLLPAKSPQTAAHRAAALLVADRPDRVPVSIGLALCPTHEPSLDAALAAADDCLRAAKQAGKGRLVAYDDGPATAAAPPLETRDAKRAL